MAEKGQVNLAPKISVQMDSKFGVRGSGFVTGPHIGAHTATESQALLLLVIRGYKEFPDQQTKNLCALANLEVKASIQTENPSTPQLANERESPFYAGEVFSWNGTQ